MRTLITGDRGFIASHLKERLLDGGYLVEGFDLGDDPVYPEVDVVFHFAAMNGTDLFYDRPFDVGKNDTSITLEVLDRYKDTDALIVFASSSELYNGSYELGVSRIPFMEFSPVCFSDISNPRHSYGVAKFLGETLLHGARYQYGTNILILRYFNVYGPGQRNHFIPDFIERMRRGEYYIVGNDRRSFMYVDDAVETTLSIVEDIEREYDTYNIGSFAGWSEEPYFVATEILRQAGIDEDVEVRLPGGRRGSPKDRVPSVKRAKPYLPSKRTTLIEGLRKTLEETP